jgi:hypothetical protein
MKRAAELFAIEMRAARSRLVEKTWRARSEPEESFLSVAATHWQLVVTRRRGTTEVTVRGPETRATVVPIPQDADFLGIRFSLGTYMPGLPPAQLVDRTVTLPLATGTAFRLGGSHWTVPGPDADGGVDDLVEGLVDAGLLVHDPIAAAAAAGDDVDLSVRTVERRVARATGLTRGLVRRIRRAERATNLLAGGLAPGDAAHLAGYADQPHLTRSLTRLMGQSPGRIAASAAGA